MISLGDLCDMVKGEYPTLKTKPGSYPLVVTASYRRSASTYQLKGPAVCIPLISSTGHGDAAIHRLHYQEGKFALANLLVALLPKNPKVCCAKYLYYLLNTKRNQLLVPLMKGTANVSLKVQDISGVQVPLPPVSEQRRIVAKIDQLTERIDEVQTLQTKVDSLFHSLLSSKFREAIKDAEWRAMAEVAPLVRRPVDVCFDGSYPELGIRSHGKGTFHKPSLPGESVGTKKLYWIHPGDLLFSNVFAWEGAIAVVKPSDKGRVGSHRFISRVPHEGVATSNFLRFYFLTGDGMRKVQEASPGGAGRNRTLGLKKLDAIEVPVPDSTTQLAFDELCEQAALANDQRQRQTKTLDALLPSILDRAFKGEL